MSANFPINEPEDTGRIEVLLQWIRQDVNGILEQQKITNGRLRKAEESVHDLQTDNTAAKEEHKEFSKAVQEWTTLKGQVSVIKNIGIFIVLLQVVAIILTRV